MRHMKINTRGKETENMRSVYVEGIAPPQHDMPPVARIGETAVGQNAGRLDELLKQHSHLNKQNADNTNKNRIHIIVYT